MRSFQISRSPTQNHSMKYTTDFIKEVLWPHSMLHNCTAMHLSIGTPNHKHLHTVAHIRAFTRTLPHTHVRIHTYTRSPVRACHGASSRCGLALPARSTQPHTCKHAYARTRTRTHVHIHTRTHTSLPVRARHGASSCCGRALPARSAQPHTNMHAYARTHAHNSPVRARHGASSRCGPALPARSTPVEQEWMKARCMRRKGDGGKGEIIATIEARIWPISYGAGV